MAKKTRPPFIFNDVQNISLNYVKGVNPDNAPVLQLTNVSGLSIEPKMAIPASKIRIAKP